MGHQRVEVSGYYLLRLPKDLLDQFASDAFPAVPFSDPIIRMRGPDDLHGSTLHSEAETFRGLALIPLFLSRPPADRDYIQFEEAVSAATVVIDEVGGGVVSRLLVHNLGGRPELLIPPSWRPPEPNWRSPSPAWNRGGGGGAWGR